MSRKFIACVAGLLLSGCGGGSGGNCTPGDSTGKTTKQYVVDKLTVPTVKTEYALDLEDAVPMRRRGLDLAACPPAGVIAA